MPTTRDEFLRGLAACASFSSGIFVPRQSEIDSLNVARQADNYIRWIERIQIAPDGLCRYYKGGANGSMISPLASAYAALLAIERRPQLAVSIGLALVKLQDAFRSNPHVSGGVPSVANESSPFYSSDAMVTLKLMTALAKRTGDERFVRSAKGLFEFLLRMSDGASRGLLKQNVNVPMQYVTLDGRVQNYIVPDEMMAFFTAIKDYADISDHAEARQYYVCGSQWLVSEAQSAYGAFYDHYDPGYPAVTYRRDRWKWAPSDPSRKIVIGDSTFKAALGAQSMGAGRTVRRFIDWLRPRDGKFYAYMTAGDGESGFLPGRVPYFDIVCSGMYCRLMERQGEGSAAEVVLAAASVRAARASDGGFFWGLYEKDLRPVDDGAEAVVTGVWGLTNPIYA